MDKIIVIDDQVTEKSTDGKRIREILGSDYNVGFVNTRNAVEGLLTDIPKDLKLVLLDLDLSGKQMQVKAEDVLETLVKNKIKVIILTQVPKYSSKRTKQNERWYELRSSDYLEKKGALGYLSKIEYDERPSFFKNFVYSIIHETHKTCILHLDCKFAGLKIIDKNDNELIPQKDISSVCNSWKASREPNTAQEALLRIFYDMGKQETTRIRLQDEYYKHLKTPAKIKRANNLRFTDYVQTFNNSIKEDSKGMFAMKLLEVPKRGTRTGIYTANIDSVKLINDEQEEIPVPWKDSVDNRFTEVQKRLTDIEKCLKQLLLQSRKD